jgi:VIT1/CCC1 family predicted Fe2+/Mn2+ transporter
MTTIAASPLTDALQTLVDARLDTIDRMLLGRVNRQDRLAIVREVESQIFDLLQGRDGESLDRDDVLAVLARLDPPEAYLPDDESTAEGRPTRISAAPRSLTTASRNAPSERIDLASGILGIISVAIGILTGMATFVLAELVIAIIPLVFIVSLLAVVFAAKVRLRGAWAIVGMVTGIMTMFACLAGGGWLVFLLL